MPIRLRLTLVVAAVTIVLVGLAGMLGTRVLRASLVAAIDEHLVQRSRPILVVVTDPDDITVDQEDLRDEVAASPDSFVQVLDPSGGVLASSPGLPTRRWSLRRCWPVSRRPVGWASRRSWMARAASGSACWPCRSTVQTVAMW